MSDDPENRSKASSEIILFRAKPARKRKGVQA